MKTGKVAGLILGIVAVIAIMAASAVIAWIRWEASRIGEPDHRADFFKIEPVPDTPSRGGPAFTVARIGDRFEIIDGSGRVVVFRGVNVGQGAESPPFQAIAHGDEEAFIQLKSWGVNALRLILPWEALETGPRRLNLKHIEYVRWFLDMAYRHRMPVIVANHQDGISRCFSGSGAPLWAHRKDTIPEAVLADDCENGMEPGLTELPRRLRWWADFWDGAWTPDDLALQDHVIWAFHKLAEVLQRHPALLGYGLFSSPICWDGTPGSLVYPGERNCEEALHQFYRRLAGTVHRVDRDALFFFEPAHRPDQGAFDGRETGLQAAPRLGSVFSIRHHSKGDKDGDGDGLTGLLENALRLATHELQVPLVLSDLRPFHQEGGGGADLMRLMAAIEDARVSTFLWDYSRIGGTQGPHPSLVTNRSPTDVDGETGRPRCFAGAFVRPYPQRIAGIPMAFGFDRSPLTDGGMAHNTDTFTLTFRQGDVEDETLVWVPRTLVYAEDLSIEAPEFTVDVSDGSWKWSDRDPNILVWRTNPEVPEHTLVIKPWGGRSAPGNGVGDCL